MTARNAVRSVIALLFDNEFCIQDIVKIIPKFGKFDNSNISTALFDLREADEIKFVKFKTLNKRRTSIFIATKNLKKPQVKRIPFNPVERKIYINDSPWATVWPEFFNSLEPALIGRVFEGEI